MNRYILTIFKELIDTNEFEITQNKTNLILSKENLVIALLYKSIELNENTIQDIINKSKYKFITHNDKTYIEYYDNYYRLFAINECAYDFTDRTKAEYIEIVDNVARPISFEQLKSRKAK